MNLLKPFRMKARGLPDILNFAVLWQPGVVICKDGSLLASFYFRGTDVEFETEERRDWICQRTNSALASLGKGWAVWFDQNRVETSGYPDRDRSHFASEIAAMIDEERRSQNIGGSEHFVSATYITLMWRPPLLAKRKLADMMWEGGKKLEISTQSIVDEFEQRLASIAGELEGVGELVRLSTATEWDGAKNVDLFQDHLVNYLQYTITGERHPVDLSTTMYLDCVLGGRDIWNGDSPQVGDDFKVVISINGFPSASWPMMHAELDRLAIAYRFSSRAIFMDREEAIAILKKRERHWDQSKVGIIAQILQMPGKVNRDAANMSNEVSAALADASSGKVAYLYYTPTITLSGRDRDALKRKAEFIVDILRDRGFPSQIETVGAFRAWLGSIPGITYANVRRPLIHTLNLSDMLPLASEWAGAEVAPCPFYPVGSPPLFQGASRGATPFRFNLHNGDVGHSLIIGPPGSGKSTLLGLIFAQFLRYPGASVFAFDKGRSMEPITLAVGGRHYDFGDGGSAPKLCPLQHIDTREDATWAEGWIATCFELQHEKKPTPEQRNEIHRAVESMRSKQNRSITNFLMVVQDPEIRSAMKYYSDAGSAGHLLDAEADGFRDSAISTIEIEELMNMPEETALPILLYLFQRFERTLKGQPALLILDEAWIMLANDVFSAKIVEWLRVLRKNNCAVVMASQSLADVVKFRDLDMIMAACPTKIYLPNPEAEAEGDVQSPGPAQLYGRMQLNKREIHLLAGATPKQDYYYTSPAGRRMFQMELGPLTLSFIGVSDKIGLATVRELAKEHGAEWPFRWLERRKVRFDRYRSKREMDYAA